MTREERCWQKLCERLQRDPATSEESDTCTLRVAFKHAIAFADAEAAAMRERAAKCVEGIGEAYGEDETGWLDCSETAATAIRALPTTEVGNG